MSTVNFAPTTRSEVRALLDYVEQNRPAVERRKTPDYVAAVKGVRDQMRAYYAVNPPHLVVRQCPWQITGASALCDRIARSYSVPVWDVVAEANPAR